MTDIQRDACAVDMISALPTPPEILQGQFKSKQYLAGCKDAKNRPVVWNDSNSTTFKIMWSLLTMALKYEEQELVNVARIRFLEKVLFVSGNSITGRLHINA